MPILATSVSSSKTYKFPADTIRRCLSGAVEARPLGFRLPNGEGEGRDA